MSETGGESHGVGVIDRNDVAAADTTGPGPDMAQTDVW